MGMAGLVVTAVVVEGRSKSEVAREYRVSRRWVITLVQRFVAEGEAGLEPRDASTQTQPVAAGDRGRGRDRRGAQGLEKLGHEAGAPTIAFHFEPPWRAAVTSTIWRVLSAEASLSPNRTSGPKSSYVRFQAEQPNERWQPDITHWRLADGTDVEIMNIIDDHSRLGVATYHAPRPSRPPIVAGLLPQGRHHLAIPLECCRTTAPCSRAARRSPGRPRTRPHPPRCPLQSLPALPPPDLREGRTLPPNPQELADDPPATRPTLKVLQRPAQHLPPLLQPAATPPRPQPPHSQRGLPRATQNHGRSPHPLIDPHYRVRPRPRRQPGQYITLRHNTRLHHIALGRRHTGHESSSSPATYTSASPPTTATSSATSPSTLTKNYQPHPKT